MNLAAIHANLVDVVAIGVARIASDAALAFGASRGGVRESGALDSSALVSVLALPIDTVHELIRLGWTALRTTVAAVLDIALFHVRLAAIVEPAVAVLEPRRTYQIALTVLAYAVLETQHRCTTAISGRSSH